MAAKCKISPTCELHPRKRACACAQLSREGRQRLTDTVAARCTGAPDENVVALDVAVRQLGAVQEGQGRQQLPHGVVDLLWAHTPWSCKIVLKKVGARLQQGGKVQIQRWRE